jgi:superfamily I DNA/RNA helicase
VTISTIPSVKGFDYACVAVIGLDWLEGTRWKEEQIRNLTYVAITRERERLFIVANGLDKVVVVIAMNVDILLIRGNWSRL